MPFTCIGMFIVQIYVSQIPLGMEQDNLATSLELVDLLLRACDASLRI